MFFITSAVCSVLYSSNCFDKVSSFCESICTAKRAALIAPDFLIKFLSLFDATLKEASSKLRYDYFIDCNQAKNVLNFKPISLEKTLVDTYDYLNTIIK